MGLITTSLIVAGVVWVVFRVQRRSQPADKTTRFQSKFSSDSFAANSNRLHKQPQRAIPAWVIEKRDRAEAAGRKGEQKVGDLLNRHSYDVMHDIILVDEKGLTQVDHVVKTAIGLVVLETKNYTGFIFGDPKGSKWTQRVDYEGNEYDFQFQNPIQQNDRHKRAVEQAISRSSVPVIPHVVFAGDARIGYTVASSVLTLNEVKFAISNSDRSRCDPIELNAAWECLRLAAAVGEPRRAEHLAWVRSLKDRPASYGAW